MSTHGRNLAPWILALTVAAAAIAFVTAQEANPDDVSGRTAGTAALVVVGIGVAVLVVWQRRWVARSRRAAALAGPMALLEKLAVKRVDERALAVAQDGMWDVVEDSTKHGMRLTLLILATMVPAVTLQNPALLAAGCVPIVLYAVFLAVRTIIPGGTLDKAYHAGDAFLDPLGLETVQRPEIRIEPRIGAPGAQKRIVGPTVIAGTRHGRRVEIRLENGRTRVTVGDVVIEGKANGDYFGWLRDLERAEATAPSATSA